MRVDYHTHSTYSDGRFLWTMCRAAADAGLDAVGFADHCNVSTRETPARAKKSLGFNLDITYERRREAIEDIRDRFDVVVHDGVEMDYDSRDVDEIAAFLETADFEYAIGSVHHLDGMNVHVEPYFARKRDEERQALVDEFFEETVALVESELFDVAAHPDLVERNPALRDYATEDHYHAVAEAAENSRTRLELNAGRVLEDYGELHPGPAFLDVLASYDVALVPGTDSHQPGEIAPRKDELEREIAERGLTTTELELREVDAADG